MPFEVYKCDLDTVDENSQRIEACRHLHAAYHVKMHYLHQINVRASFVIMQDTKQPLPEKYQTSTVKLARKRNHAKFVTAFDTETVNYGEYHDKI